MKNRVMLVAAALFLASCTALAPRGGFLQTRSAEWNEWLDQTVDVRLENLPLHLLPTTAEFETGEFLITEAQAANLRVDFRADGITRREALRRIGRKHDLMIRFWPSVESPRAIVITWLHD